MVCVVPMNLIILILPIVLIMLIVIDVLVIIPLMFFLFFILNTLITLIIVPFRWMMMMMMMMMSFPFQGSSPSPIFSQNNAQSLLPSAQLFQGGGTTHQRPTASGRTMEVPYSSNIPFRVGG